MSQSLSVLAIHARRLCISLCLAMVGCGVQSPVHIPPRLAGQLPPGYRLDGGRGVVLARFRVTTQSEPGFGAITNPLLVQFREVPEKGASGTLDEGPQGVSLPSPDTRVWASDRDLPTLWQYQEPGLMAASFKPGTYDGLVIAYLDIHQNAFALSPSSIPAPSRGLLFEPIEVPADTIVYVGTIQIRQSYGFWDRVFDRVDVDFSTTDDYDSTVAEFRARYPQFHDTPVEKRLAQVVTPLK